jgi:hypothetical protein
LPIVEGFLNRTTDKLPFATTEIPYQRRKSR